MILDQFDYIAPETLEEVVQSIKDNESELMVGDQSLVGMLKKGNIHPKSVVSLRKVPSLNLISEEGETLIIGPTTPYSELIQSSAVNRYTTLAEALHSISDPHLLHHSTIGGAFYYEGDIHTRVAAALVATDAELSVLGPEGERQMKAASFFEGGGISHLLSGEIIRCIKVINMPFQSSTYQYVSYLNSGKIICGAAVLLKKSGNTIDLIRIVLSGCTSGPIRLRTLEADLAGKEIEQKIINNSLDRLDHEALDLRSELISNKAYLRHLVKVLITRAIMKL